MFNIPQKYITRNDIKEIKKKFDWIVQHSNNSKIPGVTFEQAAQIIAKQIDSTPYVFQKCITKSNRKLLAQWPQILEVIEGYNQQQETAFDNQIYEQSSYQFVEDKFILMKPQYFQVSKPQEKQIYIFYIENMAYIKQKQEFLILTFNNKTLALLNLNTLKVKLTLSVRSIEKVKRKQNDEYMTVLERLDQNQIRNNWQKQVKFYQNNQDQYQNQERLDTSYSFKEKLNPIDLCKKDIEFLQKIVNINPWDSKLRPLNPDPKLQLQHRIRGKSEHTKRYALLQEEEIYRLNQTLSVQQLVTKNDLAVFVLENFIVQLYQLEYDFKNQDYVFSKLNEFQVNDKIDQLSIIQNKWTKELHLLIFIQKFMHVYSIPNFKHIEKLYTGQQADAMHSSQILVVCQYDGLFSIIKENIRINKLEQCYLINLQKKVKFNDLKQSISSLDYSDKYQMLIFGSMCTLISIFDLRKNSFIYQFSVLNGIQQCNLLNERILSVHIFDQQNQYIVVFSSGYVSIWDIQRHKKIQEFMKQVPQNKSQKQYYQSLFMDQKGMLFIGGYNLQTWISRINPIQIQEPILDSNSQSVQT